MDGVEIAHANHVFWLTQVPECLCSDRFKNTLGSAYCLAKIIRADGKEPGPEDIFYCDFKKVHVAITVAATEAIKDSDINLQQLVSALHLAIGPHSDTGKINDTVTVSVSGHRFMFSITHYMAEDPTNRWVEWNNNPLSIPSDQTIHRIIMIDVTGVG